MSFIYTDILFIYIVITVIMQSNNVIMFFFLNIIYLLNSIHLVFIIICHLFIYLITCSIHFHDLMSYISVVKRCELYGFIAIQNNNNDYYYKHSL